VIYIRNVRFAHAECDLLTKCDFDTHKCDNDSFECDVNTHKSDFFIAECDVDTYEYVYDTHESDYDSHMYQHHTLRVEIILLCDVHTLIPFHCVSFRIIF
jgi:hypothetical protein